MTRDIAAIREREAGTGEETWTHLADLTTDNAKWLARYADQADADRTALLALLDEAAAALRGMLPPTGCTCGHCNRARAVLAKLEGK